MLNPIILAGGTDKFHHHLSFPQLSAATALIAAIMTIIMGVGGNLPLAVAAGLGLDGVVAFQIAPTMSWPDAMGLVVIEGLGICLLVVTGLRQVIMDAIPLPLKQAISVGIGLFIAFIGLVDAGFVHTPNPAATPVSLGANGSGTLVGWPVVVFCVGLLLTITLLTRRVPGAILRPRAPGALPRRGGRGPGPPWSRARDPGARRRVVRSARAPDAVARRSGSTPPRRSCHWPRVILERKMADCSHRHGRQAR